ncbi:hypothetical protein ACS0TY_013574 [Phlomoides rotata]
MGYCVLFKGLLGTVAFAFFCFYLLLAVIAGAMILGLKLVFIMIHPMKWGATLMNSFLFNVGLILLCSIRLLATGYLQQITYNRLFTTGYLQQVTYNRLLATGELQQVQKGWRFLNLTLDVIHTTRTLQ